MSDDVNARIDEFLAKTLEMDGKEVRERVPWNTEASEDAIRHFAYGTDDANPLWTDPEYAAKSRYKTIAAPPAFFVSVLYPILHGAPMEAPLSSLIGGVECEWHKPILAGDKLRAASVQKSTFEKKSKGGGRRLIFVISECTYWNQNDEVVAKATGTMIRATQTGDQLMLDRPVRKLGDEELKGVEAAYRAEKITGAETRHWEDVSVDEELPPITRGPLTIGDMVAWNAALGPSYKAGRLGYLDLLKAPHNAVTIPQLGFPVKNSQQHEDVNIAAGRGMPGPFDNGVMRFAWACPFVTNWMGDDGFLKKCAVQVRKPGIYGDIFRYAGKVTEKTREGGDAIVKVEFTGTNQSGEVASTGAAEVILPLRNA